MTSRSRAACVEALAADRDLGVAAVELEGGLAARTLGALDPGLGGQQVGAGGAGAQADEPGFAGGRGDLGGLAQHRLAAQAVAQFAGEVLACTLFGALAQRPHPLETERKGRTVHDRVDRPLRRGLERLDARWNFGAGATPLSSGATPVGSTPSQSASSRRPSGVTATARTPGRRAIQPRSSSRPASAAPERAREMRPALAPVDAHARERPPCRRAARRRRCPARRSRRSPLRRHRPAAVGGIEQLARDQRVAHRDAERAGEVVVARARLAVQLGGRGLAQRRGPPLRRERGERLERLGDVRAGEAVGAPAAVGRRG